MTRKKAIAKVDAGEASFTDWYVAQFGERPSEASVFDLEERVRGLEIALMTAKGEARAVAEWEARADAALMAWTASKVQK